VLVCVCVCVCEKKTRMAHRRPGPHSHVTILLILDKNKSLNDEATDKIRKYRADYNNNPPSVVSFIPPIPSTSGSLHSEFIRLWFLQDHWETDRFFAASGVAKTAVLRINLNLDGAPIACKSHTHPSHSQTSRLLTSSLSLCVPVPRPTQCL
jgi:hypothetical protein